MSLSNFEAFMPSGVPKIIPSRLLILAWVILWITTIPLFHTHLPDISPDISDGPAFQGRLAHTVFSPDLPGEFSRFSHVTHRDNFAHQDDFAQLSKRVSNSPELGFVLLNDDDTKKRKVGPSSVLGGLFYLPNTPLLLHSALESVAVHCWLLDFAALQAPRAPPSVVSL